MIGFVIAAVWSIAAGAVAVWLADREGKRRRKRRKELEQQEAVLLLIEVTEAIEEDERRRRALDRLGRL